MKVKGNMLYSRFLILKKQVLHTLCRLFMQILCMQVATIATKTSIALNFFTEQKFLVYVNLKINPYIVKIL